MKRARNSKAIARGAALLLAVLTLLILPICNRWRQNNTAAWQVQGGEGVIRLHVRASGDSPAEQRFKMALVAQVRRFFSDKALHPGKNYSIYLDFLRCNLPALEKELQRFAGESAQKVPVTVKLCRENFPLRTYGRRIYPAGSYSALVVTVGEGSGENWWCLLFPPLCLPPAEIEDEIAVHGEPNSGESVPATPGTPPLEKEKAPASAAWQSKIWELFKRRGQSIVEKAEQIFYN